MEDGEMAGLPATSTNRKEEKRARQVSLYADRSFARGVAVQWCVSGRQSEEAPRTAGRGNEGAAMKINVQIGDGNFCCEAGRNAAADAQATPLTVETRDYGGFEKVGPLGQRLPTENTQTTTQAGDIVLYQGQSNCHVLRL